MFPRPAEPASEDEAEVLHRGAVGVLVDIPSIGTSQHSDRKTYKYYSREKNHKRREHRHRKRTPSFSSSSSSSSSSNSGSRSVSSSTRRRRNTPHFKFKIGEKLGHKYKVTRLLGTGTFGRVVEARYKEAAYAVKVSRPVCRSSNQWTNTWTLPRLNDPS